MLRRFYQKHKLKIDRFDGLLLNNTVLERGLVIAPVIVGANSMKNALILGISFAVITFLTVLLSSFVPKRLPYTVRVILYTIVASLIFIPTARILDGVFPDSIFKVGIFLPLLVTNSLIVTKIETRFLKEGKLSMVLDLFCHVAGFFLVIVLVGAVREIFGNGTFMGKPFWFESKFEALLLPFGGFVLVAFLSAGIQQFRIYLNRTGKRVRRRRRKV